ncbi:MAG: PAS domain S-box protein, partial [Anaerolineae bacterium]|nr:PAS domain S-box protein [Anaerolineae bacterium]
MIPPIPSPIATRNRIAMRLMRIVVLLTFGLGFSLSAVETYVDYRQQEEQLDQTMQEIAATIAQPAAQAAYLLNQEYAQEIVDGLIKHSPVLLVEISDDYGNSFAAASRPHEEELPLWFSSLFFEHQKTYSWPLYLLEPADLNVGQLTMTADVYDFAAAFYKRTLFTFASTLLQLFILAAGIYFLVYLLIAKPLLQVTQTVAEIDPAQPPATRLPVPKGHADDELGLLVDHTNDLIHAVVVSAQAQSRTAAALSQSETRFGALLESAPDAIVNADDKGEIVLANSQAEKLFGYSQEEMLGQPIEILMPGRYYRSHLQYRRDYYQEPVTRLMHHDLEITGLHKNGKEFPVEVSLSPIEIDGALHVTSIIRDITVRRETQQRIKNQVEDLAALRKIDQAINANLNLNAALDIILENTTSRLGVDAAFIMLLNQKTRVIEPAAGRGFKTEFRERSALIIEGSVAGQAISKQCGIFVPNMLESPYTFSASLTGAPENFVSYYAVPLITKDQSKGVLGVLHRSQLDPSAEWVTFLETLAGQSSIALENATLLRNLQLSNTELSQAYSSTLEGWSKALDLRDRETEGHTQRVTNLTVRLAKHIGVPAEQI